MTTKQIQSRFFDSVKRGTGEAYLLMKNHPGIDFSKYIIRGALKNYAYDGQCEDSRAQYIFDLTSLSNQKVEIREAVLKGLATEQEDTWSLTHLFDIAKLYAQHGDDEARQSIYDRFSNHPIEGAEWIGYNGILELDGFKGLVFIAEKLGKYIEQNPDNSIEDTIIGHYQDEDPNFDALQELKELSKNNKYIKTYLDFIDIPQEYMEYDNQESQTFENIIEEIPYLSYSRIHKLNEEELSILAKALIEEREKAMIQKLLNVFRYREFPLDSDHILNLAKQKKHSKYMVKEFAIDALTFLKSHNIRQFALDGIAKAKDPYSYTDILISNYEAGDYKLLVDVVNKFKGEYIIEQLAISYLEVYKTIETNECLEPLEALYNKMNCGIHRKRVIEFLLKKDLLSERIKGEIKHDSFLETRNLALSL